MKYDRFVTNDALPKKMDRKISNDSKIKSQKYEIIEATNAENSSIRVNRSEGFNNQTHHFEKMVKYLHIATLDLEK